jgi:signal peptidase I
MVKNLKNTSSADAISKSKKSKGTPEEQAKAFREGFESIVIAIVLAFLFRAFEAEAFVIPTGSMANTLRGRHKDIECEMCGQQYQTGDSDLGQQVQGTVCPSCFYATEMHHDELGRFDFDRRHVSHTGDRILVNKFAYESPFGEPQRWDVIVFKNPKNAKQNYIKRLVGLPGETIKIFHGDVYAKGSGETEFKLVRKPPRKLWYMLQFVNDSAHPPMTVQQGLFPPNWQARSANTWTTEDAKSYHCESSTNTAWLDYRQLSPSFNTWEKLETNLSSDQALTPMDTAPVLITDFYSYNERRMFDNNSNRSSDDAPHVFSHWVGDLCVDADVDTDGNSGTLEFQLIEAGRIHSCIFDLATGQATLSIDEGKVPFDSQSGEGQPRELTAKTKVTGGGNHSIRFANVDNQLTVWVDRRVVDFGHPATYTVNPDQELPVGSLTTPGDLHPIRIGATGTGVSIDRLQVFRDIYYIAPLPGFKNFDVDATQQMTEAAMLEPSRHADHFKRRGFRTYELGADQFFPMGDNSPSSLDARLWIGDQFVERDMLIGKAVFIYWPHPYHVKIPFSDHTFPIFPDLSRMKLIR